MTRVPFDHEELDSLMDEAGMDALLATSPHACRYLLGGYGYFLYETLDGIGRDRYMPVVGYVRGRLDQAFYVGAGNESWHTDLAGLWVPAVENVSWGAGHAAGVATRRLRDAGLDRGRIGIEPPYLAGDALRALEARLPAAATVDAGQVLEDLRAVKSARELELMRAGSEAVVDAMLATFDATAPGATEAAAAERLRIEETARGLRFGYCLVASGPSLNRAPSAREVRRGEVISLDSGADHGGYVADLCRMGIAGDPSPRHKELLGQVGAVQRAARGAIRAGEPGRGIFEAAATCIAELPDGDAMSFLAHGTGLLSHEAPRLTDTGSPPYPATHRDLPLRVGMVLSVETQVEDAEHGFVKLEDTVEVTAGGHEAYADHGRGWNVLGG